MTHPRCGIDVVDKPGVGTDRGPDAQGLVLSLDEDLEVIVDDRLVYDRGVGSTAGMEEDRVAAEALGLAGQGGLGAVEQAARAAATGTRSSGRFREQVRLQSRQRKRWKPRPGTEGRPKPRDADTLDEIFGPFLWTGGASARPGASTGNPAVSLSGHCPVADSPDGLAQQARQRARRPLR